MARLVEIGHVRKTHGYRGEVKLAVDENVGRDLRTAKFLFLNSQSGEPLPYTIEHVRGSDYIVALGGVVTREDAAPLRGRLAYLRPDDVTQNVQPSNADHPDPPSEYDRFLGYSITEVDRGELGMIEEIVRYPQQQLAKIEYDQREVLVPLNQEFISGVDFTKKIVFVRLPEGLLDL